LTTAARQYAAKRQQEYQSYLGDSELAEHTTSSLLQITTVIVGAVFNSRTKVEAPLAGAEEDGFSVSP
jgi:hypothetical protein